MPSQLHDRISEKCGNPCTAKELLVYFIPGNPGLIEYYRFFLTLLLDSLRSKYPDYSIHVTGNSLSGFEVRHGAPQSADGPLDLEQQIQYVDRMLTEKVDPTKTTRVVLVGHSVGSYIMLEILRRQNERQKAGYGHGKGMQIVGAVGLFPTVTEIAKSPSGRKISLLFTLIPFLPFIASLAAKVCFSFLPTSLLQTLVGLLTDQPPYPASVTTAFLQSATGVRQALHLASYEMREITTDKWDDEIWGVADSSAKKPDTSGGEVAASAKTKLFFLFGTDDHWVANETRDQLIAARAASNGVGDGQKPTMEVDETGLSHGFCISESWGTAYGMV